MYLMDSVNLYFAPKCIRAIFNLGKDTVKVFRFIITMLKLKGHGIAMLYSRMLLSE